MQKNNKAINSNELPTINLKEFFFKIISYWKLFVISLIIALSIAKFKNGYEEKSYTIDTLITTEDEQNPLFSSSTNIAFNWGGESNAVEIIKEHFKSRTHNEKVVKLLQFYIEYLVEGRYRMEDVYGAVPFNVEIDTNNYQLLSHPIKIKFTKNNKVNIHVDFEDETKSRKLINYAKFNQLRFTPQKLIYDETFDVSENIITPFCNFKLNKLHDFETSKEYFIRFKTLNSTVSKFEGISISNYKSGTSILELSLTGSNKARLVDYLKTSISVLGEDQKKAKIAYAVRSKNYIDTIFKREENKLLDIEKKISKFKDSNNIYNVDTEGQLIFNKINSYDEEILNLKRKIDYADNLLFFINSHNIEGNSIPVATTVGFDAPQVSSSLNELVTLTLLKNTLESEGVTFRHPEMIDITSRIKSTKDIIYKKLTSLKTKLKKDLNEVNKNLNRATYELKKIPKLEQELIKFQRSYTQTEINYSYLKQKSYEAGTAIAANVSEIKVIDEAKDTGQGSSKPKTAFNYLVAVLLSLVIPLFYITVKQLLDDNIMTVEQIESLYKIPVLGVVGRNTSGSNLAVFEKPKSSVAESFRALRSNIQFLFDNNTIKNRTIVLTSSVSGEGKTMVSINMATVLALSGKKTILIGLDLRKPKIFGDFDLKNDNGIVNHLIGQKTIKEVTHNTKIPNLDLIISGPIPPNPSELILSKNTELMIANLKREYDYIIIDTPPVGLVSDALELFKYADANIYVIRQSYSKKGMMKMIDDKYVNGEVKNIGYVLNDFKVGGKYGYGYGYGNYGNNYHENPEKKAVFSLENILNKFKKS